MKKYPANKDSGVEWIGKVPQNWTDFRLNTLISKNNNGIWGGDPQNNDDDLVCVRVADFDMDALGVSTKKLTYRNIPENQQEDRLLNNHTLLIEKSGGGDKQPVGRVVKYDLDYKAVCSNFIAKLELVDYSNPQYMVYFFNFFYSVGVNKRAIKQTTGIQNLDTKLYFNERIFLPPLPEQTTIANFLDHKTHQIDDLILKKERLIELLKEERTATINHAVTKGLDPNVPMKDSGIEWLGEIPEHWEVKKIKFIKSTQKSSFVDGPFGSNLKSIHYVSDGDVYVVESGFITTGEFISKEFKTITQEHFETIKRSECKEGDIIISKIGANFGMSGILPRLDKPSVVSGNSLKLTVDSVLFSRKFIHYALMLNKWSGTFDLIVNSTAQPALSLSSLNEVKLVVPSLEEQIEIVEFLKKEINRNKNLKIKINKEISLLKEYKTALINEAVTGKIDVRDYKINHVTI